MLAQFQFKHKDHDFFSTTLTQDIKSFLSNMNNSSAVYTVRPMSTLQQDGGEQCNLVVN